jgi:hypothetical protein
MTKRLNIVRVALNRPRNPAALVIFATAIVQKMTGNAWFPQPTPSLTKVRAAIKTLDVAHTNAQTGTKGLVTKRDEVCAALVNVLNQLKTYVQAVANENPEQAHSIIETAGMSVASPATPVKLPFDVRADKLSGSVLLAVIAAAKMATYYWQMSTDACQTWKDLGPTKQAKKKVPDLVPQKTYWFRYRVLTRRGLSDWSEALSFIVR